MGALSYRAATTNDVHAVVALVEAASRGESCRLGWTTVAELLVGQRTDGAAVRASVDAVDRFVLLAFDGDKHRGNSELRRRDGGTAFFGMFAVSPALQGAGVGRTVIDEAERQVRDLWGATRMEMTVLVQREDLIGWYERRGYRRTGATEPFPYGDERFGLPSRPDLMFEVLAKDL